MELQEVQVIIDKNGDVHIEVHGVKGMSCVDLTKDLEEALGGEVESRELTMDAYETVQEDLPNCQHLQEK